MKSQHTHPEPERTFDLSRSAYCVEEAAERLSLGRTFVFQLIREGKLNSVRVGRRRLVPAEEIDAFLSRLQRGEGR